MWCNSCLELNLNFYYSKNSSHHIQQFDSLIHYYNARHLSGYINGSKIVMVVNKFSFDSDERNRIRFARFIND